MAQEEAPKKKGMSLLAKIGIGFVGLVVLGAIVSKKEPAPGFAGSGSEQQAQVTLTDLGTLLSEYKGNELRADATYKDKWIQVNGKLGSIKKDIADQPYITLGTGAQFEIPQVQCFLTKAAASKASSLSEGQQVTAKGRVSGLMMNVLVKDCDLR